MHQGGWLGLLDARSFLSLWFWIVLAGGWSLAGRAVLGVPMDVIARARREAVADPAATPLTAAAGTARMALLDWLSLTLPQWRLGPGEAAILAALAGFVLAMLAVLGFGYGFELAQALSFMAMPFAVLTAMRLRLARRLLVLIAAAQSGALAPARAAADSLRLIRRHRLGFSALALVSVAAAAVWGMRWIILHPYGY